MIGCIIYLGELIFMKLIQEYKIKQLKILDDGIMVYEAGVPQNKVLFIKLQKYTNSRKTS